MLRAYCYISQYAQRRNLRALVCVNQLKVTNLYAFSKLSSLSANHYPNLSIRAVHALQIKLPLLCPCYTMEGSKMP